MQQLEYIQLEKIVKKGSSSLKLSDLNDNGGYPVYGAQGLVGKYAKYQTDVSSVAVIKDGAGVGRPQIVPPYSSVLGTMQLLIPIGNTDVNYLYYLLKHLDLGSSFNGATIPHIYFKDYGKKRIIKQTKEEQKTIGEELSKIEELINAKLNQLDGLEELIQSKFYELFGDINENTKSFEKCEFGEYVTQMNIGPFGSDLKNSAFVSKELAYCMVYEQKHAIEKRMDFEPRYVTKDKYDHLKRFDVGPGDIIVSCRGTIGECFLLPNNAPHGIIHPSLMMIKPTKNVNNTFLLFLLEKILSEQNETGSGVKMAIRATELSRIITIKPPKNLQDAFADFFDNVVDLKKNIIVQISSLKELLNKKMSDFYGDVDD